MSAQQQGADAQDGRWVVIPRTLSLVTHGHDVLLLKRGAHKRVFPNQYNGLGGHIENHEDPLTSAIREIKEESGLEVTNIRLRGVSNINSGQPSGILLFIFTAEALSRSFVDTEEGQLEWVPLAEIFSKDLVEDFPYLMPLLFGDTATHQPFFAHVSYDAEDHIVFRVVS